MPRLVVHGPHCDSSVGIHASAIKQGLEHIFALLGHCRQNGRVGKMMKTALDWAQLVAGTGAPILSNPSQPLPHVDAGWITSIRPALAKFGFTIKFTNLWQDYLQREGDSFIMKELLMQDLTPSQAKQINLCRMWLQVSRASDIVHPDGQTILPFVLAGEQLTHRKSKLDWPRCPRPP